MTEPYLPAHSSAELTTIWCCPQEGCGYRERGLADHPLHDGVCGTHRRRALIREEPRGQSR